MNAWYWAGMLIITFVARWWPRLARPNARDSDSYYHLLQAENIRQHRFRLPRKHPQFVLPGEYIYPPGYHYLLALFPRRLREEFEKISSPLFDTLLLALFMWLAGQELGPLGWDEPALFLLGLAFSLSPALVAIGTGPRAYQGTARTLGELVAAVAFVGLWKFWSDAGWLWMGVAFIAAALLLNTSKFAAQVLLFFCLLLGFLLNSATLVVFPFFSIVGAIVLSRGNYWRVFKNQIAHLQLYATKIIHSHPTTLARKQWTMPKTVKELGKFLLLENVYSILAIRFSVLLLAAGLLVWNVTLGGRSPVDLFLLAWLVAAFIVFGLISTPRLLFLGEADRYLEYALVPGFLVFATLLDTGYRSPALLAVVVGHLLLYAVYVGLLLWQYGRRLSTGLSALAGALNSQPKTVVLSIIEFAPWELAYRTHHQILFSESLTRIYFSEEEYQRLFWRYPWPRPDLRYYVEEYGVGLIVVSKREVEKARKEGCLYDFSGLDTVFESQSHFVYSVPEAYTGARLRQSLLDTEMVT